MPKNHQTLHSDFCFYALKIRRVSAYYPTWNTNIGWIRALMQRASQ
jgi:hypothetical protein